ncbi:3',5'-cyclic-nucleotide phosphodiesterase [Derxia gummosa]|uniref:3',5'-cyclic-nucleotide phosphodiesterase n=1 Tax=Derxia gummosa DSM 723 TaxID=1121388 RepID=A0A8B6X1D7_9BURK|nr:3',5'-cyclic-nucleotide phosphodiesterase [Derxia gummosa]
MRLRVLGCSGGIGDGGHTTSFLVDDDLLIDAGTGVCGLDIAALARIDHVFVTHAHLDHVCGLAFIIDSVFGHRRAPLRVHALPATLAALRDHMFNGVIWPDFTRLRSHGQPSLEFIEFDVGAVFESAGRRVEALPAAHQVPAVGYRVDAPSGRSFVFTGDTAACPARWDAVNRIPDLALLVIETAFCNAEADLALRSQHLCPASLADDIAALAARPALRITHLKPSDAQLTMEEVRAAIPRFDPLPLRDGEVFTF